MQVKKKKGHYVSREDSLRVLLVGREYEIAPLTNITYLANSHLHFSRRLVWRERSPGRRHCPGTPAPSHTGTAVGALSR